jgi:4'-phosphopantetheinyl transferase
MELGHGAIGRRASTVTNGRPAIDVWYLAPEDPDNAALVAACEAVLAPDELARANRFRFPQDRASYVAAHGMLRFALSRHMAAVLPEAWSFSAGEHGKPEIAGEHAHRGIRFSISHTRGFAVCAVTRGSQRGESPPSNGAAGRFRAEPRPGPRDGSSSGRPHGLALGVDVEAHTRDVTPEVAHRYFSRAERDALFALAEADRPSRSMELWTLKEAFVKAIGLGLTCPIDQVIVRELGVRPRLDLPSFLGEAPAAWQFGSWLVEGHRVALAVRSGGDHVAVQIRRWGG